MKQLRKIVVITLLCGVLITAAGCAEKPAETFGPSAASNNSANVESPPDTAATPSASQQPVTPSSPPAAPAVIAPPATNGQTDNAQQASLILGRARDESTKQITQPAASFKAGEQFYFGFNNGTPFGSDTLHLQYESALNGEILNKYAIKVNPDQSYYQAVLSFKQPGQYKLVFIVEDTVRASQVFTIE